MSIKSSFLIIFVISSLLFSCKKKNDDPVTVIFPNYVLTAKINGVDFKASLAATSTPSFISFSAGIPSGKTINLNMPTNAEPGTFKLGSTGNPNFFAGYFDGSSPYITAEGSGDGSGTLTITEITIDSSNKLTKLIGTFSYKAYTSHNEEVSITEGVVNYRK